MKLKKKNSWWVESIDKKQRRVEAASGSVTVYRVWKRGYRLINFTLRILNSKAQMWPNSGFVLSETSITLFLSPKVTFCEIIHRGLASPSVGHTLPYLPQAAEVEAKRGFPVRRMLAEKRRGAEWRGKERGLRLQPQSISWTSPMSSALQLLYDLQFTRVPQRRHLQCSNPFVLQNRLLVMALKAR